MPEAEPCIGEGLKFTNGVRVTPVGVNHVPAFFEGNKDFFAILVSRSQFVLLELDPYPKNDPMAFTNDPGPKFYKSIADEAWKSKKPIICVDPVSANGLELSTATLDELAGIGALIVPPALLFYSCIEHSTGKLDRRTVLKRLVMGVAAAAVVGNTYVGRVATQFVDNYCSREDPNPLFSTNAFSYDDFRNTTSILGLDRLAEEKLIEGTGVYFVGLAHLRPYVYYAKRMQEALSAYRNNIHQQLRAAFNSHPMIRIWEPADREYDFSLVKTIPVLV